MLETGDSEQPHLVKAMYSLLMLLPQTAAYAQLRNRLSCVPSPQLMPPPQPPSNQQLPLSFQGQLNSGDMTIADSTKMCKCVPPQAQVLFYEEQNHEIIIMPT